MKTTIIVLGSPPAEDIAALQQAGRELDGDIVTLPDVTRLIDLGNNLGHAGVVSFLPCTEESLNAAFGGEPAADKVARVQVFQRIDTPDVPLSAGPLPLTGVFRSPLSREAAWSIVKTIVRSEDLSDRTSEMAGELMRQQRQKNLLVEVGTALSRENDLDRLLELILIVSRDITTADAGSIYIRESMKPGGPYTRLLRFKVTQNDSVVLGRRTTEFQLPIDENSIAGYVAHTGRLLMIDDVNAIDGSKPYRVGRDVQKKLGYFVKSMLTVPLKNKDGEVVGVLQLMNKKRKPSDRISSEQARAAAVVPFSIADVEFIESVASQAAVSIERAQLYENIRELFEGFLSSSIAAIDERDRVTSGHSKRVMGYAMAFADAAAADPASPFAQLAATPDRRRQFQFAALLHDIGKIGVPERVLTKVNRLSAGDFALVSARLDYIALALRHAPETVSWKSAGEVEADRSFLDRINKAGRLSDEDSALLEKLRNKRYRGVDGKEKAFLSDQEYRALSIRVGNLTPEEREIINSHAVSTYRILSKIPWTRQLEMIPVIAATHHEKLDGSGYPNGLKGAEISLESKVLAVADIFEALVAQDRPYKPKMSPEKAMEILEKEVAAGRLDAAVVRFFRDKGIYHLYADRHTV